MKNSLNRRIIGTGRAVPRLCLSNEAFIERYKVDSTPEWIESRTGIKQRYFCGEGESTSTLAQEAAEKALKSASIAADEVDMLIVATCTPDLTFPSVSMQIHGRLGMRKDAGAFDLQAACSGFVHGLAMADALIVSGQAKTVLVIGAEVFSKLLDFTERETCVLFGDGAGAVLLQAEEGDGTQGMLASQLYGETHVDDLKFSGDSIIMAGREVFKQAVRAMGTPNEEMFKQAGVLVDDVDWAVPHQANKRIIEAAAKAAEISMDKVVVTVDNHANTSAATVPMALDSAVRDGKIKEGQLIYLQAFGAGFAWGEALLRW